MKSLGQIAPADRIQRQLTESDLEFVRVLEDVIAALIARGALVLTDLPQPAQEKLRQRLDLRGRLGDLGGLVAAPEEPALLP